MKEKYNILTIGNSTTIINTIIVALAGFIFAGIGSTLLQFGIDQTLLTQIIGTIVATIFAIINAQNHNTFWNKDTDEINIPTHMSEEQVAEIEQLIRYYTENEENETTENTSLSASADNLNENNEEDDVNEEDDGC